MVLSIISFWKLAVGQLCVSLTIVKISKTLTLVTFLTSTFCPGEEQNHEDSQQVVLFTGNNGKIFHLTPIRSVTFIIQWILMKCLLWAGH